jgi:hypothetical protein
MQPSGNLLAKVHPPTAAHKNEPIRASRADLVALQCAGETCNGCPKRVPVQTRWFSVTIFLARSFFSGRNSSSENLSRPGSVALLQSGQPAFYSFKSFCLPDAPTPTSSPGNSAAGRGPSRTAWFCCHRLDCLQDFDVLVLDAFVGDSVPVHLLTRRALAGSTCDTFTSRREFWRLTRPA